MNKEDCKHKTGFQENEDGLFECVDCGKLMDHIVAEWREMKREIKACGDVVSDYKKMKKELTEFRKYLINSASKIANNIPKT